MSKCNHSSVSGLAEADKPGTLLISPLSNLVQELSRSSLEKAEDILLSTLRSHRCFDDRFTKAFLLRSLPHMVVGYIFLLAAVITLLVFFIASFRKCCCKTHDMVCRGELCFFFKSFLLVIASAFFLLGVISQLQTAVHLDEALLTLPARMRLVLPKLAALHVDLNRTLDELSSNQRLALHYLVDSVADLPAETTGLATRILGDVASSSQHLAAEIQRSLQVKINATGMMMRAKVAMLAAAEASERLDRTLVALGQRVERDEELPLEHRLALASALEDARKAAHMQLQLDDLPDWDAAAAALAAALSGELPRLAASTLIEQHWFAALAERIESGALAELRVNASRAIALGNATAVNMTNTMEALLPQKWLDDIAAWLESLQFWLASLEVDGPSEGQVVFSGRTLLALFPGIQGILALAAVATGVSVAAVEMRRHRAVSSKLLLQSGRSLGAQLLWFSAMFAGSLVWLHLLLAGLVQLTAYVTTTACQPLLDKRIFTDLLDDPKVWGGETYLDLKIAESMGMSNLTNGARMQDLLENCRCGQSLLVALGVDLQGPVFESVLDNMSIIVNSSLLESLLHDVLFATDWLSEDGVDAMRLVVQNAHDAIDLAFNEQVQASIKNHYNANVSRVHLQPLLLGLPRAPIYDYVQDGVHNTINGIKLRETDLLPELRIAVGTLAALKRALATSLLPLNAMAECARNGSALLRTELWPAVRTLARACAEQGNERVLAWRRTVAPHLSTRIGGCSTIHEAFAEVSRGVCSQGVIIMNAVWVTHALMGVTLMVMMLLLCHLAMCLNGARVHHLRMRLSVLSKISEQSLPVVLSVTSNHEIVGPRANNGLSNEH